ncbi:glycoside hydrolase family 88 protein [uncultured Bacteroides sp.]|uniref:glycoside hydrolase family 88 protein n=1 Tax=uncultured Bacteroides sp. TaxID=162156 RepID=UPI002AABEA7B|nr:glycoside hydrolase family 88 protein [uncultured Bacteroides sp.]
MKRQISFLFSFLLLIACSVKINATVKLPSIFSDNMVLQENTQVSIWGKASANEKITVTNSWNFKRYVTTADADGRWTLKINTPRAAKDQKITVRGENVIQINNVLIGEVWLCSGQSNMEFQVSKAEGWRTGMLNETEEMKDADYPEIRLFHVEHQLAHQGPVDDCVGHWVVCNPANLKDFSAVGFVFGRKLHKDLKVPVGLIQSTWGGTHAESWTKMGVMENDPLYADVLDKFALKNVKIEKNYCKVPATLWNGMINPILPYTIKGTIWYQGESNSDRFEKYQSVFTNMINSWRAEWKQPDMPFYFVQIAPQYKQPAGIREAQLKTWQSVKNTGMAVITDAGDSTDIHPRNKRVTGERLASWSLAKSYGKKCAYSGPLYKSMKKSGNKIVLSFDYVEDGLNSKGEVLKGFFISGTDRRFYPAKAIIVNNKVEVSAPEVLDPVAVRYGWGFFFRVNLFNNAGFPASPFRTDNFQDDTYARRFADSEMRRFPHAWQLDHGTKPFWGYAQGVGCCAMLKMWKLTGDKRYFKYVKEFADSLINDKGEITLYDKSTYNIDYVNSGKVLFDLYKETGNQKYKLAMDVLIRQLKDQPRTLEGGYWHKLTYQHQIWLDGIYMASPFMAQYGAEFGKPEWIDEAVKQIILCHNHTFDAKTGLYYHAWDESKSQRWANPETGLSPNFWGRSIGWYFMAMVDALDYIPTDHAGRATLIGYIQGLADALPNYQDKNGLWYQVLDQPKREGNFPEASVTTQFMYAYAKAVNKGYIDKKYRVYAEKAFEGLKNKLIIENGDGTLTLTRCCQVGGLGGNPYRDGSFEYYIGEKMRDNDAKATGPYIMGCIELGQ